MKSDHGPVPDGDESRPVRQRYSVELRENADGSFFAQIPDLPGCMTEGATASEALENLADAQQAWVNSAIEDGAVVPSPRDDDDFSGKFVIRVPRSMHRDLVSAARREGVSLNALVAAALGEHLGLSARQRA